MSNFQFSGVIKEKMDTVQVSDKFSRREFVVTDTSTQYPQDIQFQLTQDKCSLLDSFGEGELVVVSFNLRGRQWISPQGDTKYFNTLEVWRIEKGDGNESNPVKKVETGTEQQSLPNSSDSQEDDDLPF